MSENVLAIVRHLVGAVVLVVGVAGTPVGHQAAAAAAPAAVAARPRQVPPATESVGTMIDPALAGVAVTGPALRSARAAEDRTQGELDAAVANVDGVRRTLGSLAVVRVQTEAELLDAAEAITAAEAALAVKRVRLRQTEAAERRAERRLATARAEVRLVAIAGYISGFDASADLFIEDPDVALAAGRRRVLGTTVAGDKVARVVTRSQERRAATRVREGAADAVDRAEVVLAEAHANQRRVTADLQAVRERISATEADERRRVEEVFVATGRRDEAHLDVLDARVLSTVVGSDLSLIALDAYWKAAAASPCPTGWWALAGIGRTESSHGTYGGSTLDVSGYPSPKIIGIALDGSGNTAAISDSDGGLLDGDAVQDRAVGPMQFIPSTWARWRADGNGDDVEDPQSIYDAAAGAARYLCAASDADLTTDEGLRRAYFSYNHDQSYVTTVLDGARAYEADVRIPPIPPT